MSGRRSRDKGARAERALVRFLQDRGFAAEKISGMYKPGADISVPLLGRGRRVEVKVRSAGFRQLYEWLDGRDLLIVRADRREPLVVLPLRLGVEVAKAGEQSKTPLSSPTSSPDAAIATINTLSAIEAEPASSIGGALRNAMT
jgi:hypothetical protein